MPPKQKFFLIVDVFGNIIDYRDYNWKPADCSPYKVFYWTGTSFMEWKQ